MAPLRIRDDASDLVSNSATTVIGVVVGTFVVFCIVVGIMVAAARIPRRGGGYSPPRASGSASGSNRHPATSGDTDSPTTVARGRNTTTAANSSTIPMGENSIVMRLDDDAPGAASTGPWDEGSVPVIHCSASTRRASTPPSADGTTGRTGAVHTPGQTQTAVVPFVPVSRLARAADVPPPVPAKDPPPPYSVS